MATSGTTTGFTITANDIIQAALSIVSERAVEVALTKNEIDDGLKALNRMVKLWQTEGRLLWKLNEGVLFLNPGQQSYKIGPGGDNACLDDDFIQSEISVNANAGAITINIESTAGMQGLIDSGVADFIGIELDDGTRQWTTIENVNSSTQLQITDNLTANASLTNTVFTYSNTISRPLRVPAVRRSRVGDDTEIDLNKWSRQQYFAQTLKSSSGTPTNFYYSPDLIDGRLYIWQTAESVNQIARFTFEKSIEDFSTSADNPDFPIEWSDALVWSLAARIGYEYEATLQKMQIIEAKAAQYLEDVVGWDQEVTSLNIQPDFTRG
jgi:hypothetical protein